MDYPPPYIFFLWCGLILLPEAIIALFLKSETLKRIERTGWTIAGINVARNESVAEHTWGVSFLSWLITSNLLKAGDALDTGKVMTMAILHDLSESRISDIPYSAVSLGGPEMKDGKRAAEFAAIEAIFDSHDHLHQEAKSILSEYEERKSLESRIVHGADILDMLFHAISLERNGVNPKLVDQFFKSSKDKLAALNIRLLDEIYSGLESEHNRNMN